MAVSGRAERAAYLNQDSQQTLREGLDEFRRSIPTPFGGNDPSSPVGQLFQCHDICHVVFGLSIDLRDEVLADTWAILGTTVGFWRYLDYLKVSDPQAILKEIGIWRSLAVTVKMAPACAPCLRHGAASAAEAMAVGPARSLSGSHTQGHSSQVSDSGQDGDSLSHAAGPVRLNSESHPKNTAGRLQNEVWKLGFNWVFQRFS